MKILMLTPYLPYPPASGGQIRTFYLLKYLAKNHSITLVSLYKNENEKQYSRYLESFCEKIYLCKRPVKPWSIRNISKAIFTENPFLIVRNFSSQAKITIKDLIERKKYDVIHAETFYIMPHIPETKIPILLVEQTIEYKVYQHFISSLPFFIKYPLQLDIWKLKFWEKYYWKKADLVATVSEFDKKEIQAIAREIEPVIIPNGAGDEMFVKEMPKKSLSQPKLLFLGNFFWLQNLEAANYLINKVYPIIKKKIKNVQLVVAGQNLSGKINSKNDPDIQIVNLKPDDEAKVKELYQNATLFISPIFGPGGTRLKILASMASGLPVISTFIGVEGLNIIDNVHALIAQTPDDFAKKIFRILSNKKLYDTIQLNAFNHIQTSFSWKNIAKKLETVYQATINKKKPI